MITFPHTRAYACGVALAAMLLLAFSAVAMAAQKSASASRDFSSGWQAKIIGHEASPPRLVAVAKDRQALFLFERHSPLRLARQFVCTTGQSEGDKFSEGDLKTPEGVYFVVRKLTSGLNFEKYGHEAYTLNYPNPVDRLRRKTGYGIWIHGRGVPITPKVTEGCVSLNNADLALLGENLSPGTPVTLAEAVDFTPHPSPEDKAVIDALHKRTFDWAKAWSSRSAKLFEFYDPEAYSIAQGESFAAFRQQKERVFKNVSYIDTKVRNVQSLQGPGYWVTWFQQDYKASNLSSRGVRRLYWQRSNKDDFRIVGMEWAPHLSGTLTAGLNDFHALAATMPESAAAPARQEAPVAHAQSPASAAPPMPVAAASVRQPSPTAPAPSTVAAEPVEKNPPEPAPQPVSAPPTLLATIPTPPMGEPAKAPAQTPPPARKAATPDIADFIESWRAAWEKGDLNAYMACYDKGAVQGQRSGAAAIRKHKLVLWHNKKPRQVELTNIRITSKQDSITADMQQSYTDSRSFADMGIKTLHLRLEGNAWRIVREDWSPMQQ